MSKAWPTVSLGQILRPVSRPEVLDPSRSYRLLGVRWYGEGLFEKESKLGQEISAQKLYRVHEGDFLYNRLLSIFFIPILLDGKCHL